MATKKRIARKKKKISTPAKVIIGAGAIVGGYYLWTKVLKPMFTETSGTVGGAASDSINTIVQTANQTTANVPPPNINYSAGFHPIGTPTNQLNFNSPIFYGTKGQEVVMLQKILNNLQREYNKPLIKEDGIFGKSTLALTEPIFYKAQPLIVWAKAYNAHKNKNTPAVQWLQSQFNNSALFAGQDRTFESDIDEAIWRQITSYF